MQCSADLDLFTKDAERITCSGNARNRNGVPTNISMTTKNADLRYKNSLVATYQMVEAFQNTSSDVGYDDDGNDAIDVDIIGRAGGYSNIILENDITAIACEKFQAVQRVSSEIEDPISVKVNAICGPLKVSSSIRDGDLNTNALADVASGVVSVDQLLSTSEARQQSRGVIGGATFDTMTKNADKETSVASIIKCRKA